MLTRRFAYKVKKPANFGFLDFSTVEKRCHFCEREVVLNARLSPGMYLGGVPNSRKKGRLVFGLGERVVESQLILAPGCALADVQSRVEATIKNGLSTMDEFTARLIHGEWPVC